MRILAPIHYLTGALATLILGPPAIVLALAGRHRASYSMVKAWSWLLHVVTGVRFRISGLGNVPTNGSYVIVSNHCSHLDGPALLRALPDPVYFIIKQELARIPLWGWTVVRIGFIAVDRGNSEKARTQLVKAIDSVKNGRCVLVFAEGTRSPGPAMLPFKKGGFHLAVDAQVPILPVAVNRSRRLLPKGALCARSGTVEVHVGTPIPTTGLGKEHVDQLLVETRAAITEMRRLDPDFLENAEDGGDEPRGRELRPRGTSLGASGSRL